MPVARAPRGGAGGRWWATTPWGSPLAVLYAGTPTAGEHAARLSEALDRCEAPAAILGEASGILAPAMSAESIEWSESDEAGPDIRVQQDRRSAVAAVPTTESPHYLLSIRDLSGGRRLLSDDIAMLERGALLVARRIDAVRSMQ